MRGHYAPVYPTDFKDILEGLTSFYGSDPDYPKQLTAIIYHIEVENAIELIYRQELIDSLNKNNTNHFNSICRSDFIDSIFVAAISEIEIFENPILALAEIEEESKVSSQHLNQAWHLFYNKVIRTDIPILKLEIDKWQLVLIKNVSDDKYLSTLLNSYFSLIDDSNIEYYLDLIDSLIKDLGGKRFLNQLVNSDISEKSYLKLIEYKGKDHNKYKLSVNFSLLDVHLSKLSIEDILKLKNTGIITELFDFIKYKEFLIINLNSFIDQNDVESANAVLIKIKENFKTSAGLEGLLDDNKIYTLFQNNSSSNLPIIDELIAMRIAKADTFNSSYWSCYI